MVFFEGFTVNNPIRTNQDKLFTGCRTAFFQFATKITVKPSNTARRGPWAKFSAARGAPQRFETGREIFAGGSYSRLLCHGLDNLQHSPLHC